MTDSQNSAPQPQDDLPRLSITEIRQEVMANPNMRARLHAQVSEVAQQKGRNGEPFYRVALSDAEDRLELRVWTSMGVFDSCAGLRRGLFIELTGTFNHHERFGLEAPDWVFRSLTEEEQQDLLGGSSQLRAKQRRDYDYITKQLREIKDPRLNALCAAFLEEFGERFRRTAAARGYHHARRGGLVEHVAQMMRLADAVAGVYNTMNRDLLIAGVLFHDCGKLWENSFPESGFTMPYDNLGELLGHINIGIELVNKTWRTLEDHPDWSEWQRLDPPAAEVRNHLLHLIASHHGTKEFGAPVDPKTPEAFILHFIDNMDAKLEMLDDVYKTSPELARGIYQRVRPFNTNLMAPLPAFEPGPETPEPVDEPAPETESETETGQEQNTPKKPLQPEVNDQDNLFDVEVE